MNKLNHQYPENPENCCCYCSYRKDYSPKGCRGGKYAENSPIEDDKGENEYGNHIFRKNGNTFAHNEIYDNLLDIIDDQMISTMSNLRKKARKFMKSEFEQSFSSDTTDHRCNYSDDIRSKGTDVKKKADEIDYQPQSTFLKKIVQHYQGKQNEFPVLNESDFLAMCEKCTKSSNKEQKAPSPPGVNQTMKSSGPRLCKCSKHDSSNAKEESPPKRLGHVSRLNKKTKSRGNRKRRLSGNCDSGDRFEPDLKQPHENSCERCWRFASPSRSPVNKPDQRYNPNFRSGHSSTILNTKKAYDLTDKKEACATPGRKQSVDTSEFPNNIRPNFTSTPKKTPTKKSNRSQNAPCEDYSTQFTPFSKTSALRPKTLEQSKPDMEGFDFEYPSAWLCDTLRSQQQKCTPRPQSCNKLKERNSLEKGIIYSSKMRNLLTRPQSLIPAPCKDKEEAEHHNCQQYTDVCGRGRLENLDPCTKRNYPAKKADPGQSADMDKSILRGDDFGENGSGEIGLENRSNMNRGSGLNMGGDDFDNLDLSEIPFDGLNDSSQRGSSAKKSKSGDDKDKISKKPSSGNKSPKSKSSKEDHSSKSSKNLGGSKKKKSPRKGSKDKNDDGNKGNCSPNEAQAYFKIPSEPKPPENCGVSHPIRNCQCYPRVINNDEDDELYCCHCDWKKDANNESRKVVSDTAGGSRRNEGCCSTRPAFSEPSTFQGCRPSTSQGYNQKPTLPNIDEFPEQLFDLTTDEADNSEMVIPCPYRLYMSKRPLNDNTSANESRFQRRNTPDRNENLSFKNENTNLPHDDNENCPRYGNGNASFGNFTLSSQMNAGYGMEYPRKYCVMYMTKGKNTAGDDVEVLVEELSQPCPQEKDGRMTNVKEKMTRMSKCPTESMALRFQKGVPSCFNVLQKSRELYF